MEAQSDGAESEQFSDAFLCCVCLDLLYKPVVLACGHISCFWCVHRSMNDLRESHCPMCRHPYLHFPTICQMLHFLLLKLYPTAYKRRETQTLEEEKDMGFFSPQFDALLCASHTDEKQNHLDNQGQFFCGIPLDCLSTDIYSTEKGETAATMERLETIPRVGDKNTSKQSSSEATCSGAVEEQNVHQKNRMGPLQKVSIADVLCTACKHLLFQPVVLNCGHVYCESCVILPENESLRCQACQTPHPGGFPKVCLELDHFLEEQFPKEYEIRKGTVLIKQVHSQWENPTTCSRKAGKQDVPFSLPTIHKVLQWSGNHDAKVHVGAGCDSCGLFPIIGERYRCEDCMEAIGFDLCGDCYNTRSKRPGRFNQQHTPEHRFKIVKSNSFHNIMVRLLRGQLQDRSASIHSNVVLENPETVFPSSTLTNIPQENAETGSTSPVTPIDIEEDQDETQSSPF